MGPLSLYFAPADVQARVAAELTPTAAQIAQVRADIAEAAGSLAGAYRQNFSAWVELQLSSLMVFVFPTVGLMMIGLGLFKTGFSERGLVRPACIAASWRRAPWPWRSSAA